MQQQTGNKIKLGIFVLTGTILLILGLYFIGSKSDLFESTITLQSDFKNVQGLLSGNNVRFNGINVGTVSKVYAINDSLIRVEFTVNANEAEFIHKGAEVGIGNDGLLGNKQIEIRPGITNTSLVEDGDVLKAVNPIEMESAMRSLTTTNENLRVITENLKHITGELQDSHSLWGLLQDTTIAENVRNTLVYFRVTGQNSAIATGDISRIVSDVKAGRGSLGALLTDTVISHNLNQTVVKINAISDTLALLSGDFRTISANLVDGKGSIGTLLTDTMFVHDLNASMRNINKASMNLNENLEALRSSWPFKKYFRKKSKEKP
jgi:phospholipid/cholesterol/gamma-HCH transport system substrate-binding protein